MTAVIKAFITQFPISSNPDSGFRIPESGSFTAKNGPDIFVGMAPNPGLALPKSLPPFGRMGLRATSSDSLRSALSGSLPLVARNRALGSGRGTSGFNPSGTATPWGMGSKWIKSYGFRMVREPDH